LQDLTYQYTVVCLLLFDERAGNAQPMLTHEMLEHIALASFLVGFLVGTLVGALVGFPCGCIVGCVVEFRVTFQESQLAFVAVGVKPFVVEDVPGLRQHGTVVAPISTVVDLFAMGNIPFVVAKICAFVVRPHSWLEKSSRPSSSGRGTPSKAFAVAIWSKCGSRSADVSGWY
jgi:hypothetical protein